MVQNSYRALPPPIDYKNISIAADEITNYIDKRRKRIIKSLQTRWFKFNNLCMGGVEPNTIYTFAGVSSAGKSSFVNQLESDLFDINPNENFCILNFNFEMLGSKQVGRKLSGKLKKTTSELYSGGSNSTLSDEDFDNVKKEVDRIKKYNIYYVDVPGNVDQIKSTIYKFGANEGKGKWMIIILDHTLLTRGRSGESERSILSELQHMFMEIKKYGRNTIIQLSQMNRNIESVDRVVNNTMHFPMRSDIFGSDSLMQSSDYLFVIHRPELLKIAEYGPDKFPTEDVIYLHCVKNREGELGMLTFMNNLKYNKLEEIDLLKLMENKSRTSITTSIDI